MHVIWYCSGGFSVNAKTGAIKGKPEKAREGSPYRMHLRAVDAADRRTTLKEWTFNVKKARSFFD